MRYNVDDAEAGLVHRSDEKLGASPGLGDEPDDAGISLSPVATFGPAVMAEDKLTSAGRIDLLRQVLSELGRELEALEEWRALRQLDEREKNGRPLEGIDGVLFRGRLVQGLAQSSRAWRAFVRIEAAIVDLEGPERLEAGILPASAELSVALPAARPKPDFGRTANPARLADQSAEFQPMVAAAATTIESEPVHSAGSAAARMPEAAASPNLGLRPTAIPIDRILDTPERLRVKIRVASQALPEPAAALPLQPTPLPRPVDRRRNEKLPGDKPGDAAVVASLSPRPLNPPAGLLITDADPGLPAMPSLIDPQIDPLIDPKSPRSVLQRIRLISAISPKPVNAKSSAPPASEPAGVEPPARCVVEPTTASADLARVNGAHLVLNGDRKPATPAMPPDAAPEAADHHSTGSKVGQNKPEQWRVAALESELEQLIDRSTAWTHPLDAARQARAALRSDLQIDARIPNAMPTAPGALNGDWASDTRGASDGAPGYRHAQPHQTGMLEPETSIDLDVDEAEVTIIVSKEPVMSETQQSAAVRLVPPPMAPARRSMPATNANRTTGLDEHGPLNGDDHAAYHLDLEEAAVEIIVKDTPSVPSNQEVRRQDPKFPPGT